MTNISMHRVLKDMTVLTLNGDETEEEVNWLGTHDMVKDWDARPVLSFQLDPSSTADIDLELSIRDPDGRDHQVGETWHLNDGTPRVMMEPIHPDWVSEGNNEMTFKADVTAGSVVIRNITVLFRRDI